MLKEQLELLSKEFTTLKTKIKTKLAENKKSLTENTQKLELSLKENSENKSLSNPLKRVSRTK
jgi:hypothetical protein